MAWDRIQQLRLDMERAVLAAEFPLFSFHDPLGATYVSGIWRSNSNKFYGLHVQLTGGFPDECPSTYITSPSPLNDYYGRRISSYESASHAMHVWKSDRAGWTKVCTYHPSDWSADQAIVKVIVKGGLWIAAYESHLDEGKNIADFLQTGG
jgi:hypothetical protein